MRTILAPTAGVVKRRAAPRMKAGRLRHFSDEIDEVEEMLPIARATAYSAQAACLSQGKKILLSGQGGWC